MLTYLMRDSWDLRLNTGGSETSFELFGAYIGRRETVLNLDPTRPGVLALLPLQAQCDVSNKVVTLPKGIVVPDSGNFRDYVVAYGMVSGVRTKLTVTAVSEANGTITVAETTDADTKVDVYCIPRTPLIVELRLEAPYKGMVLSRTLWVADVSMLAERHWWKVNSGLFFPMGSPLPEDWVLALYVKCSLPLKWTDITNEPIPHRIAIPVVINPAQGLQDALKQSLLSELVST